MLQSNFAKKFIKSEYADSIYYADLFRINDKVWMIMGYGKSNAARIASSNNRDNDLSRDATAIKVENNILKARVDFGAINIELEQSKRDELHRFYNVDYIVYCLSPEQTEDIFHKNERKIVQATLEDMSYCSTIYPYSGSAAQLVFSNDELTYLNNQEKRIERFKEIVSQAKNIELLFMPFMDTIEQKAELYQKYI